MKSLSEFVVGLEEKRTNLIEDILVSISALAEKDDILFVVRRAGILEGVSKTKQELEQLMKGENESEDESGTY